MTYIVAWALFFCFRHDKEASDGTGNSGSTGNGDGNDLVFENNSKTKLVIQKFVDDTANEPLAVLFRTLGFSRNRVIVDCASHEKQK